jgi:apolipoprotein N-acyltransferase
MTGETDPYDAPPGLWRRHPHLAWALAVFATTVLLTYVAFPPVSTGEAAYALALPAVLWAYRRPSFKLYAGVVLGAQAVAWTALLGWLHNVTWVGLFLLGPFIGLIVGSWWLAAWWVVRRVAGQGALWRITALLGLAGLWVVLEWVRTTLFGGFPWLPLAASQWQSPLILQMASYAGAGAVGFVLIFFNLGAAAYAHRIFFEGARGLRKRSPEFMAALMLLIFTSFPLVRELTGSQPQKLARIALVQPYIPQTEKWDAARARAVLQTIEQVTRAANEAGAPDAIFWPEAVLPWALDADPDVRAWLEKVSNRAGKPLLLGSVYTQKAGQSDERWYNGAFLVDPLKGLVDTRYAKRKLVPFGEFIPLRPVFGWLEKVVPIGGDFQLGQDAAPLLLPVGTKRVPVGMLICYEDIFPALARDSALAGAEVLAVITNNAWFGEGGAAYQHAAHSVLRAVETRRPVVRCGNGGWSGWIDECGRIRATLRDENGRVYFRGAETVTVSRDQRWRDRHSVYTLYGDWFLVVCVGLVTAAYASLMLLRPPVHRLDGETAF